MTKPTQGGKRENAGRKLKYGEPTKKISTRVPESRVKEFRELVGGILNKWVK